MSTIPLCVPFERKDEARRAGARWDRDQRAWMCDSQWLASDRYGALRPFLPRMFRREIAPPYIRPWMVPQTLWGKNLRALLPKEQWDIVRRHAYAATGNRCRVCGGRGPQWPVEADEAWAYDDATLTQTLKSVVALCPDCHHIRHWGKTSIDGNEEEAFGHMMAINRWTRAEAEGAVEFAFEQWERRSRLDWTSDYSWVTRTHGFTPDETGVARAETSNRELVASARQRAEEEDRLYGFEALTPQPEAPRRMVIPGPSPQPERKITGSLIETLRGLFR